MSPDIVRALPMQSRVFSHSLLGLFTLDLPLAILLAWVVSLWLVPRAARLPGLERLARTDLRFSWSIALLGAVVGGLTHLGWDLFTHEGPPIFHAAFLDYPLLQTQTGPFLVRQLAWPIHSIIGITILLAVLLGRVHGSPRGLHSLLAGPWIRLGLTTILTLAPLLANLPLTMEFQGRDMAMLLQSNNLHVKMIMLISAFSVFGLFLFETRTRRQGRLVVI